MKTSRPIVTHASACCSGLHPSVSRRNFLRTTSTAALLPASASPRKLKVSIFSKHLQFLQGAALAEAAANVGFDGIDLTLRKGGHVEPSTVHEKLPELVEIIRKNGLDVPMVTTDIVDAQSPFAENVLRCLSELGIRHYRWGGFKYTQSSPISAQLEALKPRVEKLAALNARYHVCAVYHTHSGFDLVGASIWDLHELLSRFDPNAVAVNYDIGHATVEGGFGGWIDSFRITGPYLRGVAVKDFLWARNGQGAWRPQWKPLGQGMVDFPKFFSMLAASNFDGPLQLHLEYPLAGGADEGSRNVSNRQSVFAAMKRDLTQLKTYLSRAGLA